MIHGVDEIVELLAGRVALAELGERHDVAVWRYIGAGHGAQPGHVVRRHAGLRSDGRRNENRKEQQERPFCAHAHWQPPVGASQIVASGRSEDPPCS
jgi:hypothetical protein